MKYKLIKELPFESSPEIGYISEEKMIGSKLHYWNANWFDPANYPEFWEKVVEKDWKILSLNIDNSLVTYNNHGRWGNRKNIQECTLEWLLKEHPNSIHSVKRKDGEIFSVGDICDGTSYKRRQILEFKIDQNGELSAIQCCGNTSLNDLTHSKEPILITEDGVEMFKGDKVYPVAVGVNPSFITYEVINQRWEVMRYFMNNKDFKYFSTQEAQRKFIEENKPVYSKKDMLDFGNYVFYSSKNQVEDILIAWSKIHIQKIC